VPRKRPGKAKPRKRAQSARPKAGVELERFTDADLRTWKRQAEDLERYHVQLFFYLEGQRALRHADLCDALRQSAPASIIVDHWARIVDYKYSLQPLSAAGSLVRGGRFNIGNDLNPVNIRSFRLCTLRRTTTQRMRRDLGGASQPLGNWKVTSTRCELRALSRR